MLYQKYQNQWDQYENNVEQHFKQKDIVQCGSEKAANAKRQNYMKTKLNIADQPSIIKKLVEKAKNEDQDG